MTKNRCEHGGLLVGGRDFVPDEPTEFGSPSLSSPVGCSCLRCAKCGVLVRQGAGFSPDRQLFDVERALATADWTQLPWMGHTTGAGRVRRFYTCRCTQYVGGTPVFVDADSDRPSPSWSCDGHPVASLPLDFDGAQIDGSLDLPAWVVPRLDGPPTGARPTDSRSPPAWIIRLYCRLTGLPLAEELATAVGVQLLSPDARLRSAALLFVIQCPNSPAWDPVPGLVRGDRALFRGIQDPNAPNGETLEHRLVVAVAYRVRLVDARGAVRDPEALGLLRREALTGLSESTVWTLARVDQAWFAEHAREILTHRPEAAPAFLSALSATGFPDAAGLIAKLVDSGALPS